MKNRVAYAQKLQAVENHHTAPTTYSARSRFDLTNLRLTFKPLAGRHNDVMNFWVSGSKETRFGIYVRANFHFILFLYET